MLRRDVLVLEFLGGFLGDLEDLLQGARDADLRLTFDLGERLQPGFGRRGDGARVGPELFQNGRDDALRLPRKRQDEVERADLGMAVGSCQGL